jgi:hypothetical protein
MDQSLQHQWVKEITRFRLCLLKLSCIQLQSSLEQVATAANTAANAAASYTTCKNKNARRLFSVAGDEFEKLIKGNYKTATFWVTTLVKTFNIFILTSLFLLLQL